MKRMLINATQEEELRMAMVDGQRLYDLNIELPSGERKKANIYKGKVTRIEPSLEAAFINYGADRHGFLPLKEISSEYFVNEVSSGGKPEIKNVLREGQDIVVQIDKEERGNKGAALTTFVSLAGRFIVLKPNKSRSGGVSRRIVGEDRDTAREALQDVDIPDGMSVILRTAGIDRNAEELQWDLDNLLSVWEAIKKVVVERPSPFLIYRESNAIIRALRDYLSSDIGEILIDNETTYGEAREFVEQVMPQNLRKLKLYNDAVPLFTRYQIESQIESAFAHSVTLPSGGSLVIDHTEALVSIDINSARATKGGDIEATAFNTNLEAADEIGRQLRLRDLGGLVVIDFIDMGPQKNQREVENRLREAVRQDRARVQIGKITRFGLLEMSRQRLRPSLGESNYMTCPRCSGIGNIRSVESLALAILRIIGEEARKERTAKVIAQLPVEVATYLLNEKRNWVQSLETRNDTQVVLVANSAIETPHYQIRRVRDDQAELPENSGTSYALADLDEQPEAVLAAVQERKSAESAAVTTIAPSTPAPTRKVVEQRGAGFLSWLIGVFSGDDDDRDHKRRKSGQSSARRDGRGGQRSRRRGESARSDKKSARGTRSGRKRKSSTDEARRETKSNPDSESKPSNAAAQKGRGEARQDDRDDKARAPGKRRSRGGRRRKRAENADGSRAANGSQPGGDKVVREAAGDGSAKDTTNDKPKSGRKKGARGQSGRPRDSAAGDAARSATAAAAQSANGDEERAQPRKANGVDAGTAPAPAHAAESAAERDTAAGRQPGTPVGRKDDERPALLQSREAPAAFEDTEPPLPKTAAPDEQVSRQAERQPDAQSAAGAAPSTPSPERSAREEAGERDPARERKPVEKPPHAAESAAEPRPAREAESAPSSVSSQERSGGNGGGQDAARPAARLLPWEPATPPEQEKEKAESDGKTD